VPPIKTLGVEEVPLLTLKARLGPPLDIDPYVGIIIDGMGVQRIDRIMK